MTIAIAPAPRIVSPNGTIGTQALFRAVDHADSSARGRTYIATDQLTAYCTNNQAYLILLDVSDDQL